MGAVEGSTLFPKIATFLLAIALLFHLIAIGAPWWSTSNTQKTEREEHIGLWKYCSSPISQSANEACFDFVDIITGGMLMQWKHKMQCLGLMFFFFLYFKK